MLRAIPLAGCFRPKRRSKLANFSRSSASSIVSTLVPIIGTPAFDSARAKLSGVCPPNCTITPSGCTRSQIFSTSSVVSGSKNKQIAGIVIRETVSGFELTMIDSMPSSFSAKLAWQQQ